VQAMLFAFVVVSLLVVVGALALQYSEAEND
jgi:hypothetical protein